MDVPAAVSNNLGNDEFIQGTVSGGGPAYWYIDIFAQAGKTNYQVTAALSGPGGSGTKTLTFSGGVNQGQTRRQE